MLPLFFFVLLHFSVLVSKKAEKEKDGRMLTEHKNENTIPVYKPTAFYDDKYIPYRQRHAICQSSLSHVFCFVLFPLFPIVIIPEPPDAKS